MYKFICEKDEIHKIGYEKVKKNRGQKKGIRSAPSLFIHNVDQ